FSSRRRQTRFSRDWSSDVCSSDLAEYSFRTDYSTCVNETMATQGCTGSHHHPHVDKVTMANRRNIGNDGGLMNAVYRLNMAFLKIGRASWRERMWGEVGGVSLRLA